MLGRRYRLFRRGRARGLGLPERGVFYLPALLVMFVIGGLLRERGHKAAPYILWAALIFAVSVSLRSLDLTLCDTVAIDGRKMGTHFAWHVLNALALFLLLRASLDVVYAASDRPVTRRAREEASEADAEAVKMPRSFLT